MHCCDALLFRFTQRRCSTPPCTLFGTTPSHARRYLFPWRYRSCSLCCYNELFPRPPQLGEELGGHIESQGLKAYKIDGGTIGFKDGKIGYLPPRIKMIFDVKGELYDGLATVEAVKSSGNLDLTFVGLDVMNATEDRILVRGDKARLHVKDELRGLISFKSDRLKK